MANSFEKSPRGGQEPGLARDGRVNLNQREKLEGE